MTNPDKTPEELATAVMRRLGLIDLRKQPSAQEQAHITDIYLDKHEELSHQNLVYWPTTAIPRAVFGAITRIVAEEFCTSVGRDIPVEQDDDGQQMSIGNHGLRMLRALMARDATGLPIKAAYF